jgi:hypothetical protein
MGPEYSVHLWYQLEASLVFFHQARSDNILFLFWRGCEIHYDGAVVNSLNDVAGSLPAILLANFVRKGNILFYGIISIWGLCWHCFDA